MVVSKDFEAFYKTANYPLVDQCDMLPEMREEAVDICVTAFEKHQADLEKATQVRPLHPVQWKKISNSAIHHFSMHFYASALKSLCLDFIDFFRS
jgi:hypothetical protein